MSTSDSATETVHRAPACDPVLTFRVLMLRARRKLLVALAVHGPQTGEELRFVGRGYGYCSSERRFLNSTLKHLKLMEKAGIVVQGKNPRDGRRPNYTLAPGLKVTTEGELTVIDFGFCVVRLSSDGD